MMINKLQPYHVQRLAYVYIRQSTTAQVAENQESRERQYALSDRAISLGWHPTQVITLDGDLGKSGASSRHRNDFTQMIASISLGEAGAVFVLEASRLSRSQADWHRLLDLCALSETLIIDLDGVYDPNDFNDLLILGFKGTMSSAELHAIKLRLQGGREHKAKKGELKIPCPIGYVHSGDQIIFDPDESIRNAIHLVFEQFKRLGSGYKVMKYFQEKNILFPRKEGWNKELCPARWEPVGLGRILTILHNPIYTGAYVYGRQQLQPIVRDGVLIRKATVRVPREKWKVILHDHHPAYITWEEYLANEKQLKDNQICANTGERKMNPRNGEALLPGLCICGVCGRPMRVYYCGDGGHRSYYECLGSQRQGGQSTICWSISTFAIDEAVEAHFLSVMNQEQIDLSLEILEQIEEENKEIDRQWIMRLERERYEAQRAERQYNAVEPENRLVVRTLEKNWNDKLEQLEKTEQMYAASKKRNPTQLSEKERLQILALASDLPSLWKSSKTKCSERKEMLSLLLKQISLAPADASKEEIHVQILWHSGALEELLVQNKVRRSLIQTPTEVVDLIRAKAANKTDKQIAQELNRKGLRSGKGGEFSEEIVYAIRERYKIAKYRYSHQQAGKTQAREDGFYSTRGLAEILGVGIGTITYWRKKGVISGYQEGPGEPWWYKVTEDMIKTLSNKIKKVKVKKKILL